MTIKDMTDKLHEYSNTVEAGGKCKCVPSGAVNHPAHYNQGSIECIDAMVSAFGKEAVSYFCLCNVFKYIWRARDKNGLEDIDKAIWYIEKYKELKKPHYVVEEEIL